MRAATFVDELQNLPKDIAQALHRLRDANAIMQADAQRRGLNLEQEFLWAKHPPSRPVWAEAMTGAPGVKRN